MIKVYEGMTADEVWRSAFADLRQEGGLLQLGRGGETIEYLHTIFVIKNPQQRWVLSRMPALNPAFALAEVIWILGGSNDAHFPNYWNSQLSKFAGQGKTYYGAYGYRLRHQYNLDQIERAYLALKNNPSTRQVNLQIWNPKLDLPQQNGMPSDQDIPCNIVSLLKVRNGKLEWTQIMRSNDVFLGTPHNFIQFTSLQEIIAGWLDLEVGHYHHYSDSLHLYRNQLEKDIGLLDIKEPILNQDTLALSKKEFDKVFGQVKEFSYSITEQKILPKNYYKIITAMQLPKSYQNIVVILACESARREGKPDFIDDLIVMCDNPMYLYLWEQWKNRVAGD